MPLLGAFSCRPMVSPEASAARMPSLILWLSPTGYCCREKQNSSVVLEYTSSRVWFEKTSAVRWRISSKLIFASCVGYFRLVWSKTRMRCGILHYVYLLGCVLNQSTRTHMYVEDCYFRLFVEIFHFVVGTWYSVVGTTFFSVSITCGATHAGRILFDTTRKRENSRVWPFEVRLMLLLDRSRA